MPNHVHLLLYAEHARALVISLQRLQLSYAWYHRRIYRTSGHLWQGRYKSLPVLDDPYLLEAGRYIERNPLEAKLAEKPDLITLSPAYLGLAPTSQARQLAWQQYVAQIRLYQNLSIQQLAGVFQGW